MVLFLTKRLALGLLTLWAVSVLVFAGTELLPGDVATAILGQGATPETVAALRDQMGLDRPAVERYFAWIGNMIQGDMGQSVATGRSIGSIMQDRVFNTFLLAGVTALVSVPLALLLGIVSVIYPEGVLDRNSRFCRDLAHFSSRRLLVSVYLFLANYAVVDTAGHHANRGHSGPHGTDDPGSHSRRIAFSLCGNGFA